MTDGNARGSQRLVTAVSDRLRLVAIFVACRVMGTTGPLEPVHPSAMSAPEGTASMPSSTPQKLKKDKKKKDK